MHHRFHFSCLIPMMLAMALLAGCAKKVEYVGEDVSSWENTACCPGACSGVFDSDTVRITYTIQRLDNGRYSFRGETRAKGDALSATSFIKRNFRLLLIRDGIVVANVWLAVKGDTPSRPFVLSRTFSGPEGGFDEVAFVCDFTYVC